MAENNNECCCMQPRFLRTDKTVRPAAPVNPDWFLSYEPMKDDSVKERDGRYMITFRSATVNNSVSNDIRWFFDSEVVRDQVLEQLHCLASKNL